MLKTHKNNGMGEIGVAVIKILVQSVLQKDGFFAKLQCGKMHATSLRWSMKNSDTYCSINHPTALASGVAHSELYIIQQCHYIISTVDILL